MKALLLVGLGGAIGAIARYKLSGFVLHQTTDWKFPLSTFVVNVLGCLVAGILACLVERRGMFTQDTRLFVFTGILGGFTTFSAFGLETVTLLRRGDVGIAALYAGASVAAGITALWAGLKATGVMAK